MARNKHIRDKSKTNNKEKYLSNTDNNTRKLTIEEKETIYKFFLSHFESKNNE
jgi:hypothetical protein